MIRETIESRRLSGPPERIAAWRSWGPYVSERAWGTVREDYSADGSAWEFLPHDLARSKAYRWGEDAIAGICDRYQILVFAPAFWNGRDSILKERLFGLSNREGNHGEDVKECYFHLDNVPSHAYMRYLYKYPQAAFPYGELVEENRRRGAGEPELELAETGVFGEDRYFDIFIELAKYTEEDILVRIEAVNRGPEDAELHVLPHLWYRNRWAWTDPAGREPAIRQEPREDGLVCLLADDRASPPIVGLPFDVRLGPRYLFGEPGARALFTNNETNAERVFGADRRSRKRHVKDAFHDRIAGGRSDVRLPKQGTKAALHYRRIVPAGGSWTLRLRLSPETSAHPMTNFDRVFEERRAETDDFYDSIHPPKATEEEKTIQRRAISGLLWNKQLYLWDVAVWLDGDSPGWPPPESRRAIRNVHWRHLNSKRVLLVPDKWEYPWFAAWDLAFQAITCALVDPDLAKEQLWLLLFEQFQHPNGQIPAYEWEFSDINPPVHAWAVWRVYNMERFRFGRADREFLEKCFHKLLINFAWWVNRVDPQGNNIFEGGFLGLDNIAVIDRSRVEAAGATLEQSDGTGWMGMFCLNLMRIALELAKSNPAYEGLATKFFQHYVYVGAAMKHMGGEDRSLWSRRDGFFYDLLRLPDGSTHRFRVRSLVGLIPLYAVERLEERWLAPFASFRRDLDWFVRHRKDLVEHCVETVRRGEETVQVLAVVDLEQLRTILGKVWDPEEFLAPHGLRSLSKVHRDHPFVFDGNEVGYEPSEARSRIKGGNSNWRGPVWLPTAFLLVEVLRKLGAAYGDDVRIAAGPEGSEELNLREMASRMADRLISLFRRGEDGRRPCDGAQDRFRDDPHWRDLLLFHEYFDGDTGAGLGASHQAGWTALVANLIDEWRR